MKTWHIHTVSHFLHPIYSVFFYYDQKIYLCIYTVKRRVFNPLQPWWIYNLSTLKDVRYNRDEGTKRVPLQLPYNMISDACLVNIKTRYASLNEIYTDYLSYITKAILFLNLK